MRQKYCLAILILITVAFMVGCNKTSAPIDKKQSANQSQGTQAVKKEIPVAVKEEVKEVDKAATKEVTKTTTKVVLETNIGNIVIEMMDKNAPMTVKNFVQYVNDGFYNGVIFHRVIPGFMIQTGGFDEKMTRKQTRRPVINEFDLSNVRGTVAMAKMGGNPNSATSQFFINLKNNGPNLDNQNGGFTVFGKVVEGMGIVDKIAMVKTTMRMGMGDVPVNPVIIKNAKVVTN